jgi:AraC family transcriptional activator of pobA
VPAGSQSLYDPRNGDLSLKVSDFVLEPASSSVARTNYFILHWIRCGAGTFFADSAFHKLDAPSLLCFSPYQRIQLEPAERIEGTTLQFHANFLCIETYHDEIGCNGVLFNDVYGIPIVLLDERHSSEVAELVEQIRTELRDCGLAHTEILLSYLKVLLIKASRLKLQQQGCSGGAASPLPPLLRELRDLIEANYTRRHSPAEYARRLHVEPRTLGKLVKSHLHKTLTELIRERVLKQAKWDLLHTLKPVKQIARELGYSDELYFSRLFKRATGYSPVFFREYETAIRGGKNLSMNPTHSSIPEQPDPGETSETQA